MCPLDFYVPGLYVGANCILSGSQLFHNLSFQHYWKSLSTVPMVETRGYQLIQSFSNPVNGIGIDIDVTQNDNMGGAVLWLSPNTAALSVNGPLEHTWLRNHPLSLKALTRTTVGGYGIPL